MKKPFLSIVIPTRQRHETLPFTIQAILDQDFDDYEIVVFNNGRSRESEKVVKEIKSSHVKYFYSDMDLSLHDSWSEAISKAEGEYVTVIADNDGFIMGALAFIKKVIIKHDYPLLIDLVKNLYNWPMESFKDSNTLYMYTRYGIEYVDSKTVINESLTSAHGFAELPLIYKAVVHSSLIKKMHEYNSGDKIVKANVSDVYGGFCFAYMQKKYLRILTPTRIAGNFSKSTGLLFETGNVKDCLEAISGCRAREEIDATFHKDCLILPQVSRFIFVYDSFLKFKDTLKIVDIHLSKKDIVYYTTLEFTVYNEKDYAQTIESIKKYCDNDESLLDAMNLALKQKAPKIYPKDYIVKFQSDLGFNSKQLILNGNEFGLKNIQDASKFMSNFYNYDISLCVYPKTNIDKLRRSAKIAIWGVGKSARNFMKELKKHRDDIRVEFFIDSFKEDNSGEIPIVKPSAIKDKVDHIVIASMFIEEIHESIKQLKLQNINISYFY